MEATTPPNTTGFDRKPKSKKRKFNRNSGRRKNGYNPAAEMPTEEAAWLFGSMFLMAAARILAPFIGLEIPVIQSKSDNTD